MANFHPEVYVRLFDTWDSDAETAEALQDFLGCASRFEGSTYPANAKYYAGLEGVPMSLRSRRNPGLVLSKLAKQELVQLRDLTRRYLGVVDAQRVKPAAGRAAT
jgi:4-hydroxy-tetrahydrodipicolinate synthase